jgi:signal transduction histidine kinase
MAPSSGRARLRRRVLAAGTVLILAFAASSGYDVWRAYDEAISGTARELTTLSRALAEEAAREFQTIDIALRETTAWYARNGDEVAPAVAAEQLAAYASGLPVLGLAVRDAHGVLRYTWSMPLVVTHDLFQPGVRSAPGHNGAQASDWIASSVDQRGHVALARGVQGDGRASGTVSALIDFGDFREFYRAIEVGAGNTIVLLRQDGMLVARHPPAAHALGKSFPEFIARRDAGAALDNSALMVSPIDGARRFVAASTVRGYPFLVVVTRDESVALAAWSNQTVHVAARTLVLSVLTALLIGALVRQLAQLDMAELEKQRLEADLRQSQKMEAIGTLAGGIAHDFNNILGAILGYSELAQKNVPAESPVRHYLDQVAQAGTRAKGLVERILAFSRSGLSERVPVHVESVVEETLELLAASVPPQVRLEKRLDAGDAAVIGDVTQLHQVAMNLCTNAVQAMDQGGVLTVTLDRVPVDERTILSHGVLTPRPYVRLSVTDTGRGIPPAVLERVFDPFFTTKAVGAGTGLGLSLVHGIVADFGGAIDVVTQNEVGTTFTVWLPAAGETPRPRGESPRELPHGRGEVVMIVDDERPLVMLAEEMLAELGYEALGFDSSVAALQAFRADYARFDLVLTDETMPEMSGTELAREVRRLRPSIPVVLMSGYSGAQLAERAHEAGVCEVLRKPLVSRDIAEALGRALSPPR